MDVFAPCDFSNIQGYPNDIPKHGMDKLPVFLGNNAISANSHMQDFSLWMGKYARVVDFNHEDVRMTLFVLTLEGDAHKWFAEKPRNSFDSLQSIINAFKEKYGDKREGRHLVKVIIIIKKREKEIAEEFNKMYNDIIKELPQDYKPTDKSLRDFCIDAFSPEPSYELRHAKLPDYRDCQALVVELEKDKAVSGKSEIPVFDRHSTKLKEPKGKEVQKPDSELV